MHKGFKVQGLPSEALVKEGFMFQVKRLTDLTIYFSSPFVFVILSFNELNFKK